MTTTIAPSPDPAGSAPERVLVTRPRRAWAVAGIVGGIAGIGAFLVSGAAGSEATRELYADNAAYVQAFSDKAGYVWAFQVLTSLAAAAACIFGAGLRRRLDEQEPAGSLVPTVAFTGLALVAAMSLAGGGISTELFHGLRNLDEADPDTVAANLSIFATLSWVWAGAGLTAGAVALGGFRHGSVSRRFAWFSAVVAGLVALLQVVPFQYLAALPGSLWLLVAGIGQFRREQAD